MEVNQVVRVSIDIEEDILKLLRQKCIISAGQTISDVNYLIEDHRLIITFNEVKDVKLIELSIHLDRKKLYFNLEKKLCELNLSSDIVQLLKKVGILTLIDLSKYPETKLQQILKKEHYMDEIKEIFSLNNLPLKKG